MAGVPTIAIYDGTHANPARIQGFPLGGDGGMVLDSGSLAGEDTSLALAGTFGELFYEDAVNGVSALVHVGIPWSEAVKLRATGNGARDLEFGLDLTAATPDAIGGVIYTNAEVLISRGQADAGYTSRVVDGKGPQALTSTVIGLVDTNIGAANIQNVAMEAGYAYRCIVHVDMRNANVGGRLDFKLWDGAVGGTQLGGTNRRWTDNSGAGAANGGTVLVFIWRATATGVSGNLNLSAIKATVTAGAAAVEVNSAYSALVEKIGNASQISGL